MSKKQIILAVDDSPTNIRIIEGMLYDDYKVLTASNGLDALEICTSEPVDLILLDIMMPEMDGYEVCKRIKNDSRTKHIPVIFLTAKTKTKDLVKGFDSGAVDYVTKPFSIVELSVRIKTHIELKTLRGLLPICSYCKNIRNDKGYYEKIELYINKHSGVYFTHTICPPCIKKHFPEEYHSIMKEK